MPLDDLDIFEDVFRRRNNVLSHSNVWHLPIPADISFKVERGTRDGTHIAPVVDSVLVPAV
jgi:hypothetical protein